MSGQVAGGQRRTAGLDASEPARFQISERHEQLLRAHRLDSIEALFDPALGERLDKPGLDAWRSRVRVSLTDTGSDTTLYLKRFNRPPLSARRMARRAGFAARTLAGLEWACMTRLAADGIPIPTPVALAEEVAGRSEVRSAILMEAVPGRSLEGWANQWVAEGDGRSGISRRMETGPPHGLKPAAQGTSAAREMPAALVSMTASLISNFHAHGYVHRDLYLAHLFYDPDAPPERALHMIDLQRVMRPGWRRRRWIVKDLASLNYSTPGTLVPRAERIRWLKRYLGVSKLDARGRRMARLVASKTARIARHDRRRQRRLTKNRRQH